MDIISHRGLWNNVDEKNTDIAFHNSFKNQFGTETDLRDYNGNLVISHDMADSNSITVEDFFNIYNQYPNKPLALNIKSDGLSNNLSVLLKKHKIENYFVFDMSIPDTISYYKNGLKFFIRQSEYETNLPFYDECNGIWLDSFNSIWYDESNILFHIANNKKVCIVSSDLHKRDNYILWKMLLEKDLYKLNALVLCTDLPIEAKKYFNL